MLPEMVERLMTKKRMAHRAAALVAAIFTLAVGTKILAEEVLARTYAELRVSFRRRSRALGRSAAVVVGRPSNDQAARNRAA